MNSVKTNTMKQLVLTIFFLGGAGLAFAPTPVKAQSCETIFETITTLFPPSLGFPTVWDASYTSDRRTNTELASSVPADEETIISFGRVNDPETGTPQESFLVHLNQRGRVILYKAFPTTAGEKPVKLLKTDAGFITLSARKTVKKDGTDEALLRWHSPDFEITKEIILHEDGYHYKALNITPALEGDGIIAVLQAHKRENMDERHSLLIRLNDQGEIVWKRFYRPGIPNKIATLTAIDGDSYIAAGEIQINNQNLMSGWILKLGRDGTIIWQRSYPRGNGAALDYGIPHTIPGDPTGGLIVSGHVTPLDGSPQAAWIMAVDNNGEPVWQRFYRRDDYKLSSLGLLAQSDGLIVAPLNATMTNKAEESPTYRSHIRLETLSPRGVAINDESYIEGLRAAGTEIIALPNNQRLITANIEDNTFVSLTEQEDIDDLIAAKTEKDDADETPQTREKGWILVTPAADPYTDPCLDEAQWP